MGQRQSSLLTCGRKLHDIGRVVVESVWEAGGNDDDAERIFGEHLKRQIGQLVMGKLKFAMSPSEIHAADLIPTENGNPWEVVEDVETSAFDVAKLRPRSFLKDRELSIGGDEMRRRAVEFKGNLGLADGKRIVAEQRNFSSEFDGFYIPLPGTVLRDPHGDLYVADLHRLGDRWYIDFDRLGPDWNDDGRFACSK
ncbi:MAG: hypothetical protein HY980_03235 [Candidatus Magasanikbacteria bacterium]|nr:hypothetical protein [Candidatus Magasanikbacteria bacterium]